MGGWWHVTCLHPPFSLYGRQTGANLQPRSVLGVTDTSVACLAMGSRVHISSSQGFSLIELLLVLTVVGACAVLGVAVLTDGLGAQQARGAAQGWQSASAWAQIGVLWQGGSSDLTYGRGDLAVSHDLGLCGGDLRGVAPEASVATNLHRWSRGEQTQVSFGGTLASPDGGGSMIFGDDRVAYRVIVRPESGLTVRTRADEGL